MIGLGIVTHNRPGYFAQVAEAADRWLTGVVDVAVVHQDGGEPYAAAAGFPTTWTEDARGVAHAKNQVMRRLLAAGCDWIIVSEDDVLVRSGRAVTGYIAACDESGIGHLSFHGHGHGNRRSLRSYGCITEWPDYVGAWCIYSAESLERGGLMDEGFHNAWEHVEHTLRLASHGFTPPWRGAADARGSEDWLMEIPGSSDASVIGAGPEAVRRRTEGLDYWRRAHPDTFVKVFP